MAERRQVAGEFIEAMEFTLPLVVDTLDDDAMKAFGAWPERLYVIRPDGTVGYKGGMGPFLFRPSEVESWLEREVGGEGGIFARDA